MNARHARFAHVTARVRRVMLAGIALGVGIGVGHALPPSERIGNHDLPPRSASAPPRFGYVHPQPSNPSPPTMITGRTASKSIEGALFRRWAAMLGDDAIDAVRAEPFTLRVFSRYFPNSTFYRLIGHRESYRVVRYGCESLGQTLILPEEINLLFLLEHRAVTEKNLEPLGEIVVKLSDPEGASTFNVLRHSVKRHWHTNEIESIAFETWSYESRERKQWTIAVRFPFLYSLEEKLLSYRPEFVHPSLGDEFSGPESGHERYILFWRAPRLRNDMRAIRADWLLERRSRRERE